MKAAREFVDVESASASGRTGFGQMLAFLKKNRGKCQTILVEKTEPPHEKQAFPRLILKSGARRVADPLRGAV